MNEENPFSRMDELIEEANLRYDSYRGWQQEHLARHEARIKELMQEAQADMKRLHERELEIRKILGDIDYFKKSFQSNEERREEFYNTESGKKFKKQGKALAKKWGIVDIEGGEKDG